MEKSIVMNIQKFSIHDGPGIRTTVFLKGCPLNCWWCHNPESINKNFDLLYFEDRCVGCASCVEVCPEGALDLLEDGLKIDRSKCRLCGQCVDFCLHDALEYVGEKKTSKEILREIEKDLIFYEESGGGVSFSGGEPFLHSDFLGDILPMCKAKGIHTTIDTSGFTDWQNIEKTLEFTDLYLYDLKLMDREKHRKYTGVDNKLILENLRKLSETPARIIVRMPIIEGVNADHEHIDQAIEFLRDLDIEEVNLLAYHKMGMEKYSRLGRNYRLSGDEVPSENKMKIFENKFKLNGIKVQIGG